MRSNEFGKLPLFETRLIARATRGESRMEYGFLTETLEKVRHELPELQQFMVDHGPAVAFQFHAGPGSGMECSTADGALSLSVRGQGVELVWRSGRGSDYPRFPVMLDLMTKVNDIWRLDVATIAYINRVELEEGEKLGDYVVLPITGEAADLKELNLNRAVNIGSDTSYDFRIQVTRRNRKEWFFSTSCGTKTDQSAFEVMENVHDVCNVKFIELLTEHAKKKWQLS